MLTLRSIFFDDCPQLGFSDNKMRLIGIPLAGLLVPIIFFGHSFNDFCYWTSVGFATFYTILYWQICRYFFIVGNKRFPDYKQNKQRITWILFGCFTVIFLLCNVLHHFIEPLFDPHNENFLKPSAFQVNVASFTTFALVAGLYESMRNFSLWKNRRF